MTTITLINQNTFTSNKNMETKYSIKHHKKKIYFLNYTLMIVYHFFSMYSSKNKIIITNNQMLQLI